MPQVSKAPGRDSDPAATGETGLCPSANRRCVWEYEVWNSQNGRNRTCLVVIPPFLLSGPLHPESRLPGLTVPYYPSPAPAGGSPIPYILIRLSGRDFHPAWICLYDCADQATCTLHGVGLIDPYPTVLLSVYIFRHGKPLRICARRGMRLAGVEPASVVTAQS